MSSIDLLESKLSTLLSKLATLEVNKLSFNSKFPDGIDVGGGTAAADVGGAAGQPTLGAFTAVSAGYWTGVS